MSLSCCCSPTAAGEHEAVLTAVALYRVVYFLVPLIVSLRAGAGLLSIDDGTLLSRLADRLAAASAVRRAEAARRAHSARSARAARLSHRSPAGSCSSLSAAFPTIAERLARAARLCAAARGRELAPAVDGGGR